MAKQPFLLSAFVSVLAVASVVTEPAAAETEISLDDVPTAVLEVAENTAPGIEFTKVSVEIEGGVKIYEFEGETLDGRHIEVDVTADGDLEEIEMEEAEDDLPEAVIAAIEDARPGAEILLVETSVSGNGDFRYEIEVETVDGLLVAFEILESGEIVSIEDGALS